MLELGGPSLTFLSLQMLGPSPGCFCQKVPRTSPTRYFFHQVLGACSHLIIISVEIKIATSLKCSVMIFRMGDGLEQWFHIHIRIIGSSHLQGF